MRIQEACLGGQRYPTETVRSSLYKIKNFERIGMSSGMSNIDFSGGQDPQGYFTGKNNFFGLLLINSEMYLTSGYSNSPAPVIPNFDNASFTDIAGTIIKPPVHDIVRNNFLKEEGDHTLDITFHLIIFDKTSISTTEDIILLKGLTLASTIIDPSADTVLHFIQLDPRSDVIEPPFLNGLNGNNMSLLKNIQGSDLCNQINYTSGNKNTVVEVGAEYIKPLSIPYNMNYNIELRVVNSISSLGNTISATTDISIINEVVTSLGSGNYMHKFKMRLLSGEFTVSFSAGFITAFMILPTFPARFNYGGGRGDMGWINVTTSTEALSTYNLSAILDMANSGFYNSNIGKYSFKYNKAIMITAIIARINYIAPTNYRSFSSGQEIDSDYFNCDFSKNRRSNASI